MYTATDIGWLQVEIRQVVDWATIIKSIKDHSLEHPVIVIIGKYGDAHLIEYCGGLGNIEKDPLMPDTHMGT